MREKTEDNDWIGNVEPIEGSFITNLDFENLKELKGFEKIKKTRRLYRGSKEELLNRKEKGNGKSIE